MGGTVVSIRDWISVSRCLARNLGQWWLDCSGKNWKMDFASKQRLQQPWLVELIKLLWNFSFQCLEGRNEDGAEALQGLLGWAVSTAETTFYVFPTSELQLHSVWIILDFQNHSTSAPWRHLGLTKIHFLMPTKTFWMKLPSNRHLQQILSWKDFWNTPTVSKNFSPHHFPFIKKHIKNNTQNYPFLQTKKIGCNWGSHRHPRQWSARRLYVVSRKKARRILVSRIFWKKTRGPQRAGRICIFYLLVLL